MRWSQFRCIKTIAMLKQLLRVALTLLAIICFSDFAALAQDGYNFRASDSWYRAIPSKVNQFLSLHMSNP